MRPEPGPTNTNNLSEGIVEGLQQEAIFEPTISPCKHMENNISALSDNSLHGLARWFTQLHASYCPRCGPALRSLRRLRKRLGLLREKPVLPAIAHTASPSEDRLTEERKAALEQAMKTFDSTFDSKSTKFKSTK